MEANEALRQEVYRIRKILEASCSPEFFDVLTKALYAFYEERTGSSLDFFVTARAAGVKEEVIEKFKKHYGIEEP